MEKAGIRINSIDRARKEPVGFRIDRRRGGGDYLLTHILAPTRIRTRDGMCCAKAGDFLVYPPGDAQWFEAEAPDGAFINDFVHAEGPAVLTALTDFGVPVGHLFAAPRGDHVGSCIEAMMLEMARREPHWEQALVLRFREFCLGLGRHLAERNAPTGTPHQSERLERFRRLRTTVLANLDRPWSVSSMAAEIHLSRTRFSVLYHGFFGLPPGEDLLRERMRRARWLLARENHTVAEVAEQCGFSNACHFSRLFRQRVGCPPRDYARAGNETE